MGTVGVFGRKQCGDVRTGGLCIKRDWGLEQGKHHTSAGGCRSVVTMESAEKNLQLIGF
ncbi:hypothetical protein BN940_05921 [Castellaniella defragrans 65Phen]|uniref:Uncharacterized protein n=1 Tax=Castellaniella defragrans (strain DSM 12143 / CCUG 39792 / 65Phen) TaxID=1437824 RepID=W8WVF3_CASD6|nr:hypothetical protein BN940_05921 [Castellaniella defragrans 65Phen]